MPRSIRYAVVVLFLMSVLTGAGAIGFTLWHAMNDERRWCSVLHDPASAAQARDFAELARKFGCP